MSLLIKYHCISRCTTLTWLVLVIASLLTSHATLALGPPSDNPRSSSAKLNQSVALDTVNSGGNLPLSGLGKSAERKVGVVNPVNNAEAKLSRSVESSDDVAEREYLPPRNKRNTFRTGDKTMPAIDRSVPWYRSGIGALTVVFVAICVTYFLVRKYMPGSIIVPCQGVKVIGRVALSPKHRAVLVKLGDRAILIGLGGDQMTTLAEITDRDEVARLSQEANLGTAASSPGFTSWLRREQEDFGLMEEADAASAGADARVDRRSPMGDLLNKLRSFQKPSLRK